MRYECKSTKSVLNDQIVEIWVVINYNGNFNSDSNNNAQFINIDLSCNKLNIQLLVNHTITCIKKRHVLETNNKKDKSLNVKATQEKKIPIKQVGKKNSKASVPISGVVDKTPSDI